MSLRLQMIVSISLVLVASLAIGAVLTYWHATSKVETEMRAAIEVGERTARRAVDALSGSAAPMRELHLIVSGFDGNRHLRASLVDSAGHPSKTSELTLPADPAPGWFVSLLSRPPSAITVHLPAALAGHGALRIETDAQNEIGEAWEDFTLKLMLMTMFCGLVLLLVYVLLGRVLSPLTGLSQAFAEVGNGRYAQKVAEDGPSELAAIYRGFNYMVERLVGMEVQNRRLNDQLMTVQEEERADIARDLHDEIGPFLFAVDVDATTIHRHSETAGHGEISRRAGAVREAVAHMQKHLRSILGRLRPATLVDLGLAHAVDHLVAFWKGRHDEIAFDVDVPGDSYGERIEAVSYRIIQESLSNAIRHGQPKRIGIRVEETGERMLRVSVSDDGGGLKSVGQNRLGLVGMRERVAALGGELVVQDRPDGRGVIVHALLPLGSDAGLAKRQPLDASRGQGAVLS